MPGEGARAAAGEGSAGVEGKRRRRGRVLIIAGLSLTFLGLLPLAGSYLYIHLTDRRAAAAQQELMRRWEDNPASSEQGNVSIGGGVARIMAPDIGLDAIVVQLAGLDDTVNLKRGPGHIPGTAYPGQPGNCVISGHRTTYGAPFRHIEQLEQGDEVALVTASHRHVYSVCEQRIVRPEDLTVLEQGDEARLTLTACHPWYSAAQRIVVVSRLLASEPL